MKTAQIIICFSPPCSQRIWCSWTLCECASAVVRIKSSTALFHCDDPYTSQLALVCRSPQTSPGMSNNKTLVCKSQYPVSVSGTVGAKLHLIIWGNIHFHIHINSQIEMQSFALVSLPVVLAHIIGVTLGVNSHESVLFFIPESRIFGR